LTRKSELWGALKSLELRITSIEKLLRAKIARTAAKNGKRGAADRWFADEDAPLHRNA
jgi:hypothetical protein